jgi:2-amino-4-hydroxy-6-hydroxymethyldihydropteridine diphosphokinase
VTARAYVGVGSNIEPEVNVAAALRRLAELARVAAISTFYRTPAEGRPDQPDYYNGVVALDTDLGPAALHAALRRIEAALGRRRSADRHAARPIDLDLVVYGDQVIAEEGLVVPDPDITRRAFLAVPLCELSPDLCLPGSGRAVSQLAARLPRAGMEPLGEYTRRLRESVP